jgi:hypothetical protein
MWEGLPSRRPQRSPVRLHRHPNASLVRAQSGLPRPVITEIHFMRNRFTLAGAIALVATASTLNAQQPAQPPSKSLAASLGISVYPRRADAEQRAKDEQVLRLGAAADRRRPDCEGQHRLGGGGFQGEGGFRDHRSRRRRRRQGCGRGGRYRCRRGRCRDRSGRRRHGRGDRRPASQEAGRGPSRPAGGAAGHGADPGPARFVQEGDDRLPRGPRVHGQVAPAIPASETRR